MNSAYLDNIKEVSAKIAVQYTNGRIDAIFRGTGKYEEISNHCMRVIYLWGIINYAYISGTIVYIGGTAVTDEYIQSVWTKLNHYKGLFSQVDLSDYDVIVADDGDGNAVDAGSGSTDSDHYRSGNVPVVVGANPVTFIKNGVASPLASADYTVEAWVIASTGQRQNNLVITTQTAGGFVASDVLKAGTLYYIATLNT